MKRVFCICICIFSFATAAPPKRLVEGWYAHNAILLMLGAQEQVVATVARPSLLPWMFYLFPQLSKSEHLDFGNLNGEELLKLHPDIVFIPKNTNQSRSLSNNGLNVVEEGFNSIEGLLDCVDSTATILQTSLAAQRAKMYRVALLQEISHSYSSLSGPKILHIVSLRPLRVDGADTIIDEWIHLSGGINAASDIHGNKQPVSIEQVLNWKPDIIIVGANAGDIQVLNDSPTLTQIPAILNKRVYRNPTGLFPWDRYGPELLLQVIWVKQIIHSGSVDEKQMSNKIMQFYKQFYGINLKNKESLLMLHAYPPNGSKW